MKKDLCIKIISLMLLPLLLFSGCSGKGKVPLAKAVAPAGFIHAEGKHLVLGEEHIMLKGVNAGGWLLTEDWLTPTSLDGDLSSEHGQYELEAALQQSHGAAKAKQLLETYRDSWWTEQDFQNIAAIGFNTVRLPFGWRDIMEESGKVKEDAFVRLDWFVACCEKYGLFVILDLHGAFGSQNGRHHSGDTTSGGDLFGNAENEQRTVALWEAVAAHYKDNRFVAGYDLLNEPEGQPGGLTQKAQWDFYDTLYKAIRAADSEHLLFMEACWDADHMPDPHTYGWENVVYEYHYYNWDNGNDLKSMKSYFSYKAGLEFKLNTLKYQVPVLIGEFTFFDNPECWRYGLEFMNAHEMSWTMWTYKGMVQSNWVLYRGAVRSAENVVTPQTEYAAAQRIFQNLQTDKSFSENTELTDLIKAYL